MLVSCIKKNSAFLDDKQITIISGNHIFQAKKNHNYGSERIYRLIGHLPSDISGRTRAGLSFCAPGLSFVPLCAPFVSFVVKKVRRRADFRPLKAL